MNQLQTVLDALECAQEQTDSAELQYAYGVALKIVNQMMQAEPVAWRKRRDDVLGWALLHQSVGWKDTTGIEPLFAAPQEVPVSAEHGNVKSSAGLIRDGKVDRFVKSHFAAPKGQCED